MGGCRCTYRNCNVKSDGKTHMFHYPVFEKVRCHQWLVNAQRLDFLSLKVSQLKNRCVCQHHFKNECFMNYKKDKLTFDAVPTLNGPYCDPSKFVEPGEAKEYTIPILLEDIENDFDINDKKSNFSLKYGDFLTNNEFIDSSARYNRNNINLNKVNAAGIDLNSGSFVKSREKIITEPHNLNYSLHTRNVKKTAVQPMLVVPPYSDLSNELKLGKELNLEQNINNSNINFNLNLENNATARNVYVIDGVDSANTAFNSNNDFIKAPKVKILSEEKIHDPINISRIAGKFEKISPSFPLILPDKVHISDKVEKESVITHNYNVKVESDNQPLSKLKVLEVLNGEFDVVPPKIEQVQNDPNEIIIDIAEKLPPQSPPKKITQIKNKVTPERSAAIEKKRKFNMRLKDIIESCLDKLDEPGKNYETAQNPTINSLNEESVCVEKSPIMQSKEKIIVQPEDKTLLSVQDSTIAYLEERMKKMESTLLNKIAQNSQEIVDFKKKWTKDASQHKKKREHSDNKRCASTQTNPSENSYKMFLYQEISKYLSPGANCTIYEELFLNKYSCEQMKSPLKRKRRKCL